MRHELWFNRGMLKTKAIELLGGTVSLAAEAIGVTYQAIDKWPDELPPRLTDRVQAALARKHLPGLMDEAGRPAKAPAPEAAT